MNCGTDPCLEAAAARRAGRSAQGRRLRRALEGFAVVAGYVGLTLWLLSPLFAHPTQEVVNPLAEGTGGWLSLPDVNLNMWVLAWDCHALATAVWHLFDANIFYPAPSALAGSEHMLGHLVIFGPVYGVSGNPVLANQVNLLLSIALCGAAMYALLRHWGTSAAAALFGGFIYAFAPIRVYGTPHAQLVAGQYLPLALLFLDRTLTHESVRAALAFGAFLLLQMLCSYYLAYMTATALVGYAIGVACSTRMRLPRRGVTLAIAAAAAAGVLLTLVSLPYLAAREIGVVRDYLATARLPSSELWHSYLSAVGPGNGAGHRFRIGLQLYVGLIPLLFAAIALLSHRRRTQAAYRWAPAAAFGLTLACYLMALGPDMEAGGRTIALPYMWAMRFVPGFSSMRVPGRFAIMMMAGLAALAGLGLGHVLRLAGSARSWWLGSSVLLVLGTATAQDYGLLSYRYPVQHVRLGNDLPAVYRALAKAPRGPVLELPAARGPLPLAARTSEYMLYSTRNWWPLLNGYSGYYPPSYAAVMALANALPDPRATELLVRTTGLRYVVVHLAALPPAQRERWTQPPALDLRGTFGDDRLFTVRNDADSDLMRKLIDFTPQTSTILGTPLAPLPKQGRHAVLRATGAPRRAVVAGLTFHYEVMVTNRSSMWWPALATVNAHLVAVGYRWETSHGHLTTEVPAAARLPYDLGPGESLRVSVAVRAPVLPGRWRLVVGLTQDEEWFPGILGPIPISVQSQDVLRKLAPRAPRPR